jgi:uncharacterized integral membrane protein
VRSWLSALIALALGAFFVLAVTRNLEAVPEVDWVFGSANDVPLWCALSVSALVGGLIGVAALSIPALRLRLRLHRAERRIAQLEREVHGLRTLPLEAEIRDPGMGA